MSKFTIMKHNILACLSFVVLAVSSDAGAADQQSPPQFSIKEEAPRAGSQVRRNAMQPFSLPINRTYSQLSVAQRATLHQWWENIPDGDEPPFPTDGLKPIFDAVLKAQQKFLVSGELFLIATVKADGSVAEVSAIGSPSQDMTKFASLVLALTKFKPAICSGQPCQMDFPLKYNFTISY